MGSEGAADANPAASMTREQPDHFIAPAIPHFADPFPGSSVMFKTRPLLVGHESIAMNQRSGGCCARARACSPIREQLRHHAGANFGRLGTPSTAAAIFLPETLAVSAVEYIRGQYSCDGFRGDLRQRRCFAPEPVTFQLP